MNEDEPTWKFDGLSFLAGFAIGGMIMYTIGIGLRNLLESLHATILH